MKVQLLMRGRDKSGHAQMYRTITEEEFALVAKLLMERDGSRPWERPLPMAGKDGPG